MVREGELFGEDEREDGNPSPNPNPGRVADFAGILLDEVEGGNDNNNVKKKKPTKKQQQQQLLSDLSSAIEPTQLDLHSDSDREKGEAKDNHNNTGKKGGKKPHSDSDAEELLSAIDEQMKMIGQLSKEKNTLLDSKNHKNNENNNTNNNNNNSKTTKKKTSSNKNKTDRSALPPTHPMKKKKNNNINEEEEDEGDNEEEQEISSKELKKLLMESQLMHNNILNISKEQGESFLAQQQQQEVLQKNLFSTLFRETPEVSVDKLVMKDPREMIGATETTKNSREGGDRVRSAQGTRPTSTRGGETRAETRGEGERRMSGTVPPPVSVPGSGLVSKTSSRGGGEREKEKDIAVITRVGTTSHDSADKGERLRTTSSGGGSEKRVNSATSDANNKNNKNSYNNPPPTPSNPVEQPQRGTTPAEKEKEKEGHLDESNLIPQRPATSHSGSGHGSRPVSKQQLKETPVAVTATTTEISEKKVNEEPVVVAVVGSSSSASASASASASRPITGTAALIPKNSNNNTIITPTTTIITTTTMNPVDTETKKKVSITPATITAALAAVTASPLDDYLQSINSEDVSYDDVLKDIFNSVSGLSHSLEGIDQETSQVIAESSLSPKQLKKAGKKKPPKASSNNSDNNGRDSELILNTKLLSPQDMLNKMNNNKGISNLSNSDNNSTGTGGNNSNSNNNNPVIPEKKSSSASNNNNNTTSTGKKRNSIKNSNKEKNVISEFLFTDDDNNTTVVPLADHQTLMKSTNKLIEDIQMMMEKEEANPRPATR
jgi:hypothetical protein